MCVDYRKLNKRTARDAYPLPLPDEVQDCLSKSTIFSILDLQSGYWQVSVNPEDRAKTAFCPGPGLGLHEFNRMPFDLTGAPSSFTAGVVGRMSMSRPKYHLSPSAGREASMTGWTTSRGSHTEQVEGGREGSVVLIPPDGKMQTACKQLKPEVHNGTFDDLVQAVHQQFQLDRWHEGKRLGAGPILVMACVPWWLRNIWTWELMGGLDNYPIHKSHLEGTEEAAAVVEEAVAATLELESHLMPSGGQSDSGAGRRAGWPGDPGCGNKVPCLT